MATWTLSDEEYAEAVDWVNHHECSIRGKYQGAIGGAITFMFTDTTIGQMAHVKCACGKQHFIDRNF